MTSFFGEPSRPLRVSFKTYTRLFLIYRLLSPFVNWKSIVSHFLLDAYSFGRSGIKIHRFNILLLYRRLSQGVAWSSKHSQLNFTSLLLLFGPGRKSVNLKNLHRNPICGACSLSKWQVVIRPLLVDLIVNRFCLDSLFRQKSWVSQLSPILICPFCLLYLRFLSLFRGKSKHISWVSKKITSHSCNFKCILPWCLVVLLHFDSVPIILSFWSYNLYRFLARIGKRPSPWCYDTSRNIILPLKFIRYRNQRLINNSFRRHNLPLIFILSTQQRRILIAHNQRIPSSHHHRFLSLLH